LENHAPSRDGLNEGLLRGDMDSAKNLSEKRSPRGEELRGENSSEEKASRRGELLREKLRGGRSSGELSSGRSYLLQNPYTASINTTNPRLLL